jgi:hypothetical protein
LIRKHEIIVPASSGDALEVIKRQVCSASCAYLNGMMMKIPEDLDLIRLGDLIDLRFDDDDEVVRRLAKIGRAEEDETS